MIKIITDKKGVGIIAAILIILIASVMGVVIASLLGTDTSSSLNYMHSQQAFFVAEAGLEHYVYLLLTDSNYRDNYPDLGPENLGNGSYSVTCTESGGTYTLTSTGTVGDATRVVTQDVVVAGGGDPDFLSYLIFFGGGDGTIWTTIKKGANITGDIFINGDMNIGKNSTVTGSVTATGTIELGNNVDVTEGTFPDSDPPTDQPTFDTTYYDNEISTASSSPDLSGDQNISGEISGTTYVDGNVTINGNLTGSGSIVATGDITIKKNKTVGDDITLISADTFTLKKNVVIGDNCLLYASNQLTIGNGNTVGSSGSDNGSVLLSDGDIDIGKDSTIYGFAFGDAEVNTGNGITLVGNLSGSEMGEIGRNSTITLDSDSVTFSSIEGFESAEVTVTPQDWDESY